MKQIFGSFFVRFGHVETSYVIPIDFIVDQRNFRVNWSKLKSILVIDYIDYIDPSESELFRLVYLVLFEGLSCELNEVWFHINELECFKKVCDDNCAKPCAI